jgi:hypothetical protein
LSTAERGPASDNIAWAEGQLNGLVVDKGGQLVCPISSYSCNPKKGGFSMSARRRVSLEVHFYLSIVILFGLITGCAPTLVSPAGLNSSLMIGRVVVNNKFAGAFYGGLPLGVLDTGLEVEIESLDGSQSFKVTTEQEGYFFVPNLTPNTYYLLAVTIEGDTGGGEREKSRHPLRRPIFTPVPGKISYIGTLIIDISERGLWTIREVREDDRARAYFFQKYAVSPWVAREFVLAGQKPLPSAQVAQEKAPQRTESKPTESKLTARPGLKAEKPEWKVGYRWSYAWKQPRRSGTYTTEIIREDFFEGIPSYVAKADNNENYYAKDVLGIIARISGGKLVYKRNNPRQNFLWPLEIGKEWRNSYLRENVQEKSSQTFDYRMVVAGIEEVKVAAGTFETFKVEVYIYHSGKLFAEYWYSPKVKWIIKEREYLQDGLREEELISFKLD